MTRNQKKLRREGKQLRFLARVMERYPWEADIGQDFTASIKRFLELCDKVEQEETGITGNET